MDRVVFASMLLDNYLFLKPAVTIVDAVVGMDGDGPSNGNPKQIGVLGGSRNALLLDLALFKRINGDLSKLPLFHAAKDRNLASVDLVDGIEVTGDGGGIRLQILYFLILVLLSILKA